MRFLVKHLTILIIGIIIFGCASINPKKLASFFTPIPVSKKHLDIPKYTQEHQFNGYPYTYWNFCKQKQKQLGLISPEISKDSLIYRVWITNPIGRKGQPHGLIEIKRDSCQWTGTLVLMHVDFNLKNLSETITDFKKIELNPKKTNWKAIIAILMKLKIDVLPTDDNILNYHINDNGYSNNATTFSFEFATKDQYRFYQYSDIYRVPDRFWQPKNVIAILDILEQEFNWDSVAREFFK